MILCHVVTGFSLSHMLVNIDSIAKNEKTIAAQEKFKVTYTQSLIFDCYGLVMNFKVTYNKRFLDIHLVFEVEVTFIEVD